MKKRNIIDVQDGSEINWQHPLDPVMLTKNGLIIESKLPGVYLRFGREYVLGKIKNEISDSLNLKNKRELNRLIDEVYQAS